MQRLGLREARSLEKGAIGPLRTALPLGNGLLVVTGWNFGLASGSPQAVPAGLELLDPKTRRYQILDSQTSRVTLAAGALIADSDGATASGLTAYSETGRVLYRLYAGRAVSFIDAVADRGYADIGAVETNVWRRLTCGQEGRYEPPPLRRLAAPARQPCDVHGYRLLTPGESAAHTHYRVSELGVLVSVAPCWSCRFTVGLCSAP